MFTISHMSVNPRIANTGQRRLVNITGNAHKTAAAAQDNLSDSSQSRISGWATKASNTLPSRQYLAGLCSLGMAFSIFSFQHPSHGIKPLSVELDIDLSVVYHFACSRSIRRCLFYVSTRIRIFITQIESH